MIGRLAAFILLGTLCQASNIHDWLSLTVADIGTNLTLECLITGDKTSLFYWYKMSFDYLIETVAEGTFEKVSTQGQFANSRFTVAIRDSLRFLNIRNVSKEDEAAYFCQVGTSYQMKFINGTLLTVKDRNQQKSVYVKQRPETESVWPGGSVTLNCSLLSKAKENPDQCPSEQHVYWFRAASKSRPNMIYTHGNRSDKEDGEKEKRSCVYSLSKAIHGTSDAGTYICAVMTCGEILFGEGTEVEIRDELRPWVIVLGTLLVGSVVVIAALIIFRNKKTVCEHCNGEATAYNHHRLAVDQSSNEDCEEMEMNYAILDFPLRKAVYTQA